MNNDIDFRQTMLERIHAVNVHTLDARFAIGFLTLLTLANLIVTGFILYKLTH